MSILLRALLPPSNLGKLENSVLSNENLYLLIQLMGKKKRRKVEKVIKTQEHKDSSVSDVIRLHDRVGTPETTVSISKTVRNQINLAYRGHITRKHIARFRKYKVTLNNLAHILQISQDSGLTHDTLERLPGSFVTPLTKLQHQSTLPPTLAHGRHNIPHVLHYTVGWYGVASPSKNQVNPCFVSFNIDDLDLTPRLVDWNIKWCRQQDMLKEIIGQSRYDRESNIAILESYTFENLNHNAAYLGW
ncbi:hypothetical protein BEWA_009770 [Theileria equi strain WA]|uniref:Uncharacterized protein n=1 Tax=Theileria equi strain WA TaxID=1537102 RepID=L0B237_THEEQ|nr:hypothetical protein BEWA_009770 [Theileria equi strain WA]AFZ81563.1 hypothetical protein BEWA_009770 [Theileria equi strain WA]|eukprot:XP_004831229.1 hypothetical protein BEWA_009770 [Theileria equi strain WA]